MKATGIVRSIDDLGRLVIPRLLAKPETPMEFFTDKDGLIILKPYKFEGEFVEQVNPELEKSTIDDKMLQLVRKLQTIMTVNKEFKNWMEDNWNALYFDIVNETGLYPGFYEDICAEYLRKI